MRHHKNHQPDPKIALMRSHPVLAGMPERDLSGLARLMDDVTALAGTVLQRENGLCRSGYILVEGQVGIHAGGREVEVLERGALIGQKASQKAPGAVALSDVRVLVMNVPALLTLQDVLRERIASVASAPSSSTASLRQTASKRWAARRGVVMAG